MQTLRPSDIHTCVHMITQSHTGTHTKHTHIPIFTLTDIPTATHPHGHTLKDMCVPTFFHSPFHTLRLTATYTYVCSHTHPHIPAQLCTHMLIHTHAYTQYVPILPLPRVQSPTYTCSSVHARHCPHTRCCDDLAHRIHPLALTDACARAPAHSHAQAFRLAPPLPWSFVFFPADTPPPPWPRPGLHPLWVSLLPLTCRVP